MSTARPCQAPRAWCRWWACYTAATVVAGVVGDTVAYIHGGYPATLSGHLRAWLGMEPRTRYGRLGQVALMGFLVWSALHLGLGILGPSRGRTQL